MAISDIQGSIHANDSKCSAALVVHGLIFAGTVTVASRLGNTWTSASNGTQDVGTVLLAVAGIAFVISISAILYALLPYSPRSSFRNPIVAAHNPPEAFFPNLKKLGQNSVEPLTPYLRNLQLVTTPEVIELELSYEVLKVQDIRRHESRYAKIGFGLLIVEVVFATGFLALMAAAAS